MASHVVTLPLYARPTFLIHQSKLKGPLLNPTQFGPTWNSAGLVVRRVGRKAIASA